MRLRVGFSAIILCVCASLATAGTVTVTSSASYSGGAIGNWTIGYASGAADLFLQSVTIDLGPTGLRFDTAPGGFGSLTSQGISNTSFTGPGVLASGSASDGGTVATFSFLDFAPGDVFHFTLDVDHADPALLDPSTCTGNAFAKAICVAARNATNNTRLSAAQFVGPNQIAGALVTFQFGGINYNPGTVQGEFQQVTLRDIILGLASGEGAIAFTTNAGAEALVTAPEPGSLATFGAGLGLLLAFARRRRG